MAWTYLMERNMVDNKPFPFLPEFFCDDVYWLVTVDGLVRGLLEQEADARRLFDSTDPDAVDGDVHLWRLNGGHLCRPHIAVKSPCGEGADPAPQLDKFCTCKPGGFECDGCRVNRQRRERANGVDSPEGKSNG